MDTVGVAVGILRPTVLTAVMVSMLSISNWLVVFTAPELQCFINRQTYVFQEQSVYYLDTAEKINTNSSSEDTKCPYSSRQSFS